MNVCIFCSAYVLDEKYNRPAKELATLLAKAGHHLVWGGSAAGTMRTVAEAFRNNGGKIYGVSLEVYRDKSYKSADEMIILKDLGARKTAMLEKSDVLIALPGGIGTFDELANVLELRKQAHHDKPIIVLNTAGFYDGLLIQLKRMEKEGFIPVKLEKLIYFADKPKAAISNINSLKLSAHKSDKS